MGSTFRWEWYQDTSRRSELVITYDGVALPDPPNALFLRHKVFSAENAYDFCYRHSDAPPPNPIMIRAEVLELAVNANAGGIWY